MTDIIKKADAFAQTAHGTQVRKYTKEPYIEHPRTVAGILKEIGAPDEVIAAALLHDVVEDTPVTIQEIEDAFGAQVAGLVWQVTDQSKPADGNRKVRKEIDRQHIAKASFWGKTIKLADLIDNTESITTHDPDFAVVYLREKRALMEVLTDGHPHLYERAELSIS